MILDEVLLTSLEAAAHLGITYEQFKSWKLLLPDKIKPIKKGRGRTVVWDEEAMRYFYMIKEIKENNMTWQQIKKHLNTVYKEEEEEWMRNYTKHS